jgi:transcriptional regulator EpsA
VIEQHGSELADSAPARTSIGLDPVDQERFLRAIDIATTVRRRHQLYLWSQGALQGVLPHALLICMLRDPVSGGVRADRFSTVPVSDEQFHAFCSSADSPLARLTEAWVEDGGRPIILRAGEARFRRLAGGLSGLAAQSVAMHGTFDQSGAPGSGFLFLDVNPSALERCAHLLELLVPYLYSALIRVSIDPHDDTMVPYSDSTLTPREVEILRLIQRGMSNTDIGGTLRISPLTVKNHVQKVLRKLAVANRGQAVMKATMMRVIPPLSGSGG